MSVGPGCFVVHKFGGSSVARAASWPRIAQVVAREIERGRHPVLVCSALGGVTDALETLAEAGTGKAQRSAALAQVRALHFALAAELGLCADAVLGAELDALATVADAMGRAEAFDPRLKARLLASGELLSTKLGAAFLSERGLRARWADARELLRAKGAVTCPTRAYLSACCDFAPDAALRAGLAQGAEVTITQGFIAGNAHGETVLLGRGGSDTSAAYLAAKLEAERLEIWSDVPGLFTADPRRTHHARLLPHVSYADAQVLGALGAKVLHPRCLAPVKHAQIPLHLRWTARPEVRGTRIGEGHAGCASGPKAVVSRSGLCLIRMQRDRTWQPIGFMADVAACFRDHGLPMDLITSSPAEIRATVDLKANPGAEHALAALLEDLGRHCSPSLEPDLACVSIAGNGISRNQEQTAAIAQVLSGLELHMVCHAADDSHVSYVIDARHADGLVGALHAVLFEMPRDASRLGPSWRELEHEAPRGPASVAPSSIGTRRMASV